MVDEDRYEVWREATSPGKTVGRLRMQEIRMIEVIHRSGQSSGDHIMTKSTSDHCYRKTSAQEEIIFLLRDASSSRNSPKRKLVMKMTANRRTYRKVEHEQLCRRSSCFMAAEVAESPEGFSGNLTGHFIGQSGPDVSARVIGDQV